MKVLLIEDEAKMRNMIGVYLQANGMKVTEAQDGRQALEELQKHTFDVIVLDIMMPVMDGYEFLQKYVQQTPVLILSAKTQIEDKLRGFDQGADDYLTKPFDLRELVARLQILTKRSPQPVQSDPQQDEWVLEEEQHRVLVQGREVPLTPKEFGILLLLWRRPARVFSREELLALIWGDEFDGELRVVDTHVKNIRDKCKKAGLPWNPIQTVWGVGYRFGGTQK